MRLVWEQGPEKDQNEVQRRLRVMLKEKPMDFYKMMKAEEAKEKPVDETPTLPPDATEERVLQLIDELLDAAERGAKL